MKERSLSTPILMIGLVALLALVSPTCGTPPPPSCPCPLTSDQVIPCSDGSVVTLWDGTDLTPCECMDADYYQPSELPDPTCLPPGANVITAIDITPDGVTFSVHDGRLDFALPAGHGYPDGHSLTVWQHTGGTCNPAANQTSWEPEPGSALVILGPPDIARNNHMRHTSIFALVELRGEASMLGILIDPFVQDNGDITAGIQVLVSSTHPELQGATLRVRLAGIEGEPAQFVEMLSKIPVGSTLALQLNGDQSLSIWWQDLIVQFSIQDILFE